MLVLAILGYVVCAPCAWVAFFMARTALQEYPNDGTTKAAYWLGLINMCLAAVGIVVWVIILIVAAASSHH